MGKNERIDLLPDMRVVSTAPEWLDVARLRYAACVAEHGKPHPEADHSARTWSDELDQESQTMAVYEDGRIASTVRMNWLPSARLSKRCGETLELRRFSELDPRQIAVCSRLAVSNFMRGAVTAKPLFNKIYELGLQRDTVLCLADCARHLLPLFCFYGFREYSSPLVDRTAGIVHRVALVLDDLRYLDESRSPFAPIARARQVRMRERPWLESMFVAHAMQGS